MKIALTYDLRDDYRAMGYSDEATAEFDSAETIAALEAAIQRNGYQTERIGHVRALAARLVAGERFDLVFNICEGLAGRSREAQVPALLEAYGIPYLLSDPLTCAVTLDKAAAKRIVRDQGIATAPFAVARTAAEAERIALAFPLFVKPLAEGTGKGCERASKVFSRPELKAAVRTLAARFSQPAIVETFLPGREFTVGIVGNGRDARVIAVMEIVMTDSHDDDVYSFVNKEECESRIRYLLADDAEARRAGRTALDAYRALDCRDTARVDIRSDAAGLPHFLEVNPLPGIHPTHSDLPILAAMAGVGYDDLIGRIVAAGLKRLGLDRRAAVRRAA